MSDQPRKLSADERILAMEHLRRGLKTLYKDRYSKEVDLRIELVRKVMRQQNLPPGDAACFIVNRADNKNDGFIWAAALEIADQDERKPELN